MFIFLPNIPSSTRKRELVEHIEKALWPDRVNPFKTSGRLNKVEMLILKDQTFNLLEYHAVIEILPDIAALRVMKRLRRIKFKGKTVIARQYLQRDWHNDRRRQVKISDKNSMLARRIGDRRRYLIDKVEE